jgi:hypothetical protein
LWGLSFSGGLRDDRKERPGAGGDMSVVIQNMGIVPDKKGIYAYDIRINYDFVARCHHKRTHGLAVLLRLAADAVDKSDTKQSAPASSNDD